MSSFTTDQPRHWTLNARLIAMVNPTSSLWRCCLWQNSREAGSCGRCYQCLQQIPLCPSYYFQHPSPHTFTSSYLWLSFTGRTPRCGLWTTKTCLALAAGWEGLRATKTELFLCLWSMLGYGHSEPETAEAGASSRVNFVLSFLPVDCLPLFPGLLSINHQHRNSHLSLF